jgi:hypothetical protein
VPACRQIAADHVFQAAWHRPKEIRLLMKDPCFDREKTLNRHLSELRKRRKQIDLLINMLKRRLLP